MACFHSPLIYSSAHIYSSVHRIPLFQDTVIQYDTSSRYFPYVFWQLFLSFTCMRPRLTLIHQILFLTFRPTFTPFSGAEQHSFAPECSHPDCRRKLQPSFLHAGHTLNVSMRQYRGLDFPVRIINSCVIFFTHSYMCIPIQPDNFVGSRSFNRRLIFLFLFFRLWW